MSDCLKCWETPCVCGEYWKNYTNDRLVEYILSVIEKKTRQDGIMILKYALECKYDEPLEQIKNKD